MKKLLLFGILLMVIPLAFANLLIDQQGELRNSGDGSKVNATTEFNLTFIYDGNNSAAYSENTSLQIIDGIWNYIVGNIVLIPQNIFAHDLEVQIMVNGSLLPSTNVTYVPKAIFSQYTNDSNIIITESQISDLSHTVDTDTNESDAMNNLRDYDCSGTDKVTGVHANGSVICGSDVDTTIADTNESDRVNNIIDYDCAGTDKAIGFHANGSILCSADVDTDTTIGNCTGQGSCTDIVYNSTQAEGNLTGNFTNLKLATDSVSSNNVVDNSLTGDDIAELVDADISDTLTCSDLVSGSSVVSDAEVDNDITIDTNTVGKFNAGINMTSQNITNVDCILYRSGGSDCSV